MSQFWLNTRTLEFIELIIYQLRTKFFLQIASYAFLECSCTQVFYASTKILGVNNRYRTLFPYKPDPMPSWNPRTKNAQKSIFFFHWNPELFGLGRQIGQINSGAFWVFSAELSAPILAQWVPCPCFPLFNHYFNKKLSLYFHIPNIYLGLGFEFAPQRIRELAFVRP
jgi:hypothetical protein